MASLTLYGSSVADATLTNACDMAAALGGTETSKTTTVSGGNNIAEILSKGGSSTTVSSIPATPTGKGWVYNKPGAGVFATANWSATITVSAAGSGTNMTWRAFRYDGTYHLIGSVTSASAPSAKTAVSFAATSFSTVTFGATDLLYFDLWWNDSGGAAADNPVVYISTSSSVGVANDFQVTTSNFTPSSTHFIICDGYGGMFV